MAIKKRKTEEQRVQTILGRHWKRGLKHSLMRKLAYGNRIDLSERKVMDALKRVRAWKGAGYQDKVFVFCLSSVLWRAFGYELISDPNYDRLKKHLRDHADDVLDKCGIAEYHAILWDEPALRYIGKGDMILPSPVRKMPKKALKKRSPARKRIKPKRL